MFKTEKEMRPVVTKWLESQGYYVAHEVLVASWCDIVACKWAERVGRRIPTLLIAVAIELKIDDVAGVLYQAELNWQSGGVTESYAAMPAERVDKMREKTIEQFRRAKCGLMSVNSGGVDGITNPHTRIEGVDKNLARRLWNYKLRRERSGA